MSAATAENTTAPQILDGSAHVPTERFLTFTSDGLSIGVSTNYVIEIITDHSITMLPLVPDYVKGVINLRGQIIPIIDINKRQISPVPVENQQELINGMVSSGDRSVILFLDCQQLLQTY